MINMGGQKPLKAETSSASKLPALHCGQRRPSKSRDWARFPLFTCVLTISLSFLAGAISNPAAAQQRTPAHQAYCLQLESELASSLHGSTYREDRASIRAELQKVERIYHRLSNEAERKQCYNYFLFSKELRRTPRCMRIDQKISSAKNQLAKLNAQLHQASDANSNAKYKQDKIIAALARNKCGPQYEREYRKRNSLSNWFGDGFFGGQHKTPDYGPEDQFKFATHRTLCVRLCDGYYFPISFATTTNRFATDQQICQERCAAPAKLFTHPNPGGTAEQMLSVDGLSYEDIKNAWRFKKEFVKGCSCKASEYNPELLVANELKKETGEEPKMKELELKPDEKAAAKPDEKTTLLPKVTPESKKIVEN